MAISKYQVPQWTPFIHELLNRLGIQNAMDAQVNFRTNELITIDVTVPITREALVAACRAQLNAEPEG